jgi:methionyl-tRNA formyltransferase
MKIAILTTDTTHHRYFVWRLAERHVLRAVFVETSHIDPTFETAHPFESLRDEYEREVLLAGRASPFRDFAETHEFPSLNAANCVSRLASLTPDVAVVFGTGKLLAPVMNSVSQACLNLHGGNPEEYRGLDSHLWAIYHRDWDNLVTTLHHVDADLDTGDIISQTGLILQPNMQLHQFRAINTQACVDLVVAALDSLQNTRFLSRRRQLKRGRYYSFMPQVLKARCVRNFDCHTRQLR